MNKFLDRFVAEFMTHPAKTVDPSITIRELYELFKSDDFNAYPVVENTKAVGLVTKFDFLNCFALRPSQMVPRYDDLMDRTVADIMKLEYIYVSSTTRLSRVLQLMVDHRIRSIPVIETNSQLEGIISREDVMRALLCRTDHAGSADTTPPTSSFADSNSPRMTGLKS